MFMMHEETNVFIPKISNMVLLVEFAKNLQNNWGHLKMEEDVTVIQHICATSM